MRPSFLSPSELSDAFHAMRTDKARLATSYANFARTRTVADGTCT